jgi:DNA-binding IclR family transcriptional regulator
LEFLLENGDSGFSKIQTEVEIPKSTLHSIIESLIAHNFITFEEETKQYRLSLRFLHFGEVVKKYQKTLVEIAKPIMAHLTNDVQETSFLGIVSNDKQVLIGVCEVESTLRATAKVGEYSLMHYTGIGKVLLSGMSIEEVDEYINIHGLEKKTENTITTRENLLKELAIVSSQGFALDNSEHSKYIRCIGSAIRDRNGKVIAALSISGPKDRVSMDRVEQIAEKVKKAAQEISDKIKCLPSEAFSLSENIF